MLPPNGHASTRRRELRVAYSKHFQQGVVHVHVTGPVPWDCSGDGSRSCSPLRSHPARDQRSRDFFFQFRRPARPSSKYCAKQVSRRSRGAYWGGRRLRDPPEMSTIPPYAETVVSVGLARPFCTVFSIPNAMFAISSRVLPRPNSSLIAESVATVTAADDPSPEELGICELIYTLPDNAHRVKTAINIGRFCPLGRRFDCSHRYKHAGVLSPSLCRAFRIPPHARRTEIPCPAHSTLPTYITAMAAYPTTSRRSPVTSPLVAYWTAGCLCPMQAARDHHALSGRTRSGHSPFPIRR